MIELLSYAAVSLTGASVVAMITLVAKTFGLKQVLLVWTSHLEMCATARRMRAAGATDEQVVRFLADHPNARVGRSP